jgi:P2-related tail formation protein
VMERLDASFDPRRAPESFLPLLARWVDLDVTVSTGPRRWRELIAAAAELARWRGTRRGLIRFLELATGATGFDVAEDVHDEQGHLVPFHVQVIAPASTRPHQAMLERIIQREKLAHVTYQLTFRETL